MVETTVRFLVAEAIPPLCCLRTATTLAALVAAVAAFITWSAGFVGIGTEAGPSLIGRDAIPERRGVVRRGGAKLGHSSRLIHVRRHHLDPPDLVARGAAHAAATRLPSSAGIVAAQVDLDSSPPRS